MPTDSDELLTLLRQLDGETWTRLIRRSSPEHAEMMKRLSPTARSLAEAIEELWQLPADAPERDHYAEMLRITRERSRTLTPDHVEDELQTLLLRSGISEPGRQILARRLGWDGQGGMTLDAAANGKMTRERVRQLESQLAKAIQRGKAALPATEAALDVLAERAPLTRERAAEVVREEGLARTLVDPAGIINAARMAGIPLEVEIKGDRVYGPFQQRIVGGVLEGCRKIVLRNGAGSVTAAVERFEGDNVDRATIRQILELDSEVVWLDEEREWFFIGTGENRAENYLRKMLAVSSSLTLNEVREGMQRYRDRAVSLPRSVLRELCKCFQWVEVDGDTVRSLVSLDYRKVLTDTEATMVDIFREDGPVLDRADAIELADRRGLNRTTTGLYLGWSAIIERIAPNRYALRGADIPTGTLEAMRGSSARVRVQRGHGWTDAGRLWIGYRLSQAVIDSHVVGVPSALKSELRGRYELAAPDDELGDLATDGTNLWGLSRLLRRYGADVGDALVLEFDLAERKVRALVGGQELLDPENRPEQFVEEPPRHDEGDETLAPSEELVPPHTHPEARPDPQTAPVGDTPLEASPTTIPDKPPQPVPPHREVADVVAEVQATRTSEGIDRDSGPHESGSSLTESDERFGQALANLMGNQTVTFRELAEATDLSAGYLNHLVHGNRPAPASDVIELIAHALSVEPTYFREYRLERVHEWLRAQPQVVDDLFVELGIAGAGSSGVFSDDSFGTAVEVLMQDLPLTYRELAERTGLSAGYLNHIVHGQRPVPERPVLVEIAKALGAAPDLFFDYRLMEVADSLRDRPDLVDGLSLRLGGSTPTDASSETGTASADFATPMSENSSADRGSDLEDAQKASVTDGNRQTDARQGCVVPGCDRPGKHRLGVRCRVWHEPSPIQGKSKTSALWAPDSDAFLCDSHALGGAHITLIYEPNESGETALKVIAAPPADDRRTPIRQESKGPPLSSASGDDSSDDPGYAQ
jgi:transcriptional regulator with XRE-family HTH domain